MHFLVTCWPYKEKFTLASSHQCVMRLVLSDQYLLIISEERNTSLTANDESIRQTPFFTWGHTFVISFIIQWEKWALARYFNVEYNFPLQNCYTICAEIELNDIVSGGFHCLFHSKMPSFKFSKPKFYNLFQQGKNYR